MTDLTNSKLEQLIAVAEAATPGPWVADIYVCDLDDLPSARDRANVIGAYGDYAKQCLVRELVVGAENSTVRQRTDATHIAAFDPPTAKALCEELLLARQAVSDAAEQIELLKDSNLHKELQEVMRLNDQLATEQANELAKLRAENEALKAALEPFASWLVSDAEMKDAPIDCWFRAHHLRTAARVHAGMEAKDDV